MKLLTLSTTLNGPLRLYASPRRLGLEHLPEVVAASLADMPRGHLLAWSAPEVRSVGFSQHGLSIVLPFPVASAGIGCMHPAKGGGFVTLFVRTADAGMIEVLGTETFQPAALDQLVAHQAELGELLGSSVTVEDWGYDC